MNARRMQHPVANCRDPARWMYIHDINADQSRRTEHLIDTSIISNLLRTSFTDNPCAFFMLNASFPLDQSPLIIAFDIICVSTRLSKDNAFSQIAALIIDNFSETKIIHGAFHLGTRATAMMYNVLGKRYINFSVFK